MKFVEIRVKRFGVFAIVLRIKKDTLTFLRRGNKVNSSVDARISFTCKPGMVKNNVCFTSEVSLVKVRLFHIMQWIFISNVSPQWIRVKVSYFDKQHNLLKILHIPNHSQNVMHKVLHIVTERT